MGSQLLKFIWILLLGLFWTNLLAEERVLEYYSQIIVSTDASMKVTETIKVLAEGDQIKRGIFRSFPTDYRDRFGNRIRVRFDVEEVLRDGVKEPYHLKRESNGVKIYIGDENVFLDPGEYRYQITYRTNRQLGFFPEFDELYWNVTGSSWDFAIEKVEVRIELPPGASVLNHAGYVGFEGMTGQDFLFEKDNWGHPVFKTTRVLQPGEGFTIAVSWPKGIVKAPTSEDKLNYFLEDNQSTIIAIAGLLLLLIYYFAVWLRVGKDPAKGIIYPLYEPPKGISPEAARYILKMGYSDRVFASAIISMAVKGYLSIKEEDGEYTLTKKSASDSILSRGELAVAQKLFQSKKIVKLTSSNHLTIGGAVKALKKSLKSDFEEKYFILNSNYLVPGAIISILTLIATIFWMPEKIGAIFIIIWLAGWSVGTVSLVIKVFSSWRSTLALRGAKKGIYLIGTIFFSLFSLPFVIGEIAGLVFFSFIYSSYTAIIFIFIIIINFLFYHLLKAPTIFGRQIMDQIEGFKLYLEVAEEDRLNFLHAPEKTPELFEKYLPYALAMGVENAWSEKFADVLSKSTQEQTYSPGWYSGTNWSSLGVAGFASSLGASFSSAISSSSTAPGSSSGSGGGGSSGGGGGGGGGGGW
ncbi:DUF2207 domain-containing protein [candidate division KSB1 bacterium]|nr:DUF2207 domain-containing protein [candidate division KSB1 bacterium]